MTVYSINGHVVEENTPVFAASSRIYRYGDGFFESMKLSAGRVLHLDLHFIRIRKSAMLLKMELPVDFNSEILEKWVIAAAEFAGTENARVRCTILREGPGLYTPVQSGVTIVLEVNKTDTRSYEWNETGLSLGAYREMSKNANYLSMLKNTSALLNVMAGIYCKENGYDECVIFNDQNRVAETNSSNLFMVSGDFVATPPLTEYCVDGVMRKVIIQLAQAYGYTVHEQAITEISLGAADEIFLTSATRGIRWVRTYNGKPLKHNVSQVLFGLLNRD
ncbi:MAG: aminotransferase class IV [Bacteroidetes bacterium]|nr:aminotransferase class IV [Bacteroidota bacterium]